MPDYSNIILPKILGRKNPALPPELVLPSYDGYGISNIPASINAWLGGKPFEERLLAEEIRACFKPGYKRVVLVVIDALGYDYLQEQLAMGGAGWLGRQAEQLKLFPLTSVCPSTTSSALTSYWTGRTPNLHGIIGYEMWVKELSMTINNILHMPSSFSGDVGGLARAGFDPVTFLGHTSLADRLAEGGITSDAFLPYSIIGSGLSQMHVGCSRVHGYVSESDLWISLAQTLNQRPAGPKYAYVYWSVMDTLLHRYGRGGKHADDQLSVFFDAFARNFLTEIEDWAREDCLVLFCADHGGISTAIDAAYDLANHPGLLRLLTLLPTCESRLPFLYVKSGEEAAVRAYFDKAWPESFTLITRAEALEMQLFGLGPGHALLEERIGDLIAIPQGNAYLWWLSKPNLMLGRHGGLAAEEMLVPLIGLDLS